MVVELGFEDFHLESRTSSFVLFTSQGPSGIPATEQSRNSTEVFSKYGKVVRLKVMEPTGENVDCAALVQMYLGQKRDIWDSAINGHAWVNIKRGCETICSKNDIYPLKNILEQTSRTI